MEDKKEFVQLEEGNMDFEWFIREAGSRLRAYEQRLENIPECRLIIRDRVLASENQVTVMGRNCKSMTLNSVLSKQHIYRLAAAMTAQLEITS